MADFIELSVDEEFKSLIPPLTEDEYKQLEENILSEGEIYTPIFTWNGYIVDGYHRARILQKHPGLKYYLTEKEFADRNEALSWICKNQLGRRNLTEAQKLELIGKRYEAERKAHGGQERFKSTYTTASPQFEEKRYKSTSERIAEELGVSKSTVERAGQFVDGLEIAEQYIPGITRMVLDGTIKPTQQEVRAIAHAAPEEQRGLSLALLLTKEEKAALKAEKSKQLADSMTMSAELSDGNRPPLTTDNAFASLNRDLEQAIVTLNLNFDGFHDMFTDMKYKPELNRIIERIEEYARSLRAQQQYK